MHPFSADSSIRFGHLLQCNPGVGQRGLDHGYAGPIGGKMVLVVIDAHSKWIEACSEYNPTAAGADPGFLGRGWLSN